MMTQSHHQLGTLHLLLCQKATHFLQNETTLPTLMQGAIQV